MRTKNARKVSKCLGLDHWVVLTNNKGFLNTSICINAHTHIYVILWYSHPVLGCLMIMKSSQSPKNIKLEILRDLTR